MFVLFILFTVIPFIELTLLLRVGEYMGTTNTLLLIIVTGFVGAYLAKGQGYQLYRDLNQKIKSGESPEAELFQGLMVFIGGVLLITPGILTDFVGLSLVFPLTRKLLFRRFKKMTVNHMQSGTSFTYVYRNYDKQPEDENVIEVDFKKK